jgi:hypothetical protein
MCAQLDRRHFSTRLTFFIAGQPEHCFADPPIRFRLMVSADNCLFEKGKTGSVVLGVSVVRFILLHLADSNFLLARWVLRHFLGLGRPETSTQGHSGPKDSFLTCKSKI